MKDINNNIITLTSKFNFDKNPKTKAFLNWYTFKNREAKYSETESNF